MHRFILTLFLMAASALCLLPAWGEAPQKVVEIATVNDLVAEIDAKIDLLGQQTASAEAFAKTLEKKEVNQAAGVIACMAQAIVEHPDKAKAKFHAADVRDAAVLLRAAKTFEEATKLIGVMKDARAGTTSGSGKPEAEWNKLTGLGRMMEEVNGRSATIRRSLRRLQKPDETARLHDPGDPGSGNGSRHARSQRPGSTAAVEGALGQVPRRNDRDGQSRPSQRHRQSD